VRLQPTLAVVAAERTSDVFYQAMVDAAVKQIRDTILSAA
jgi:hypothetical protein